MSRPPVLLLTQSDDLGRFVRQALSQSGYAFTYESPHPLPRFLLRRSETLVLFDLPASEVEGRAIYTLLQAEFPRRLGAIGARSQLPGYGFMSSVPIVFKPFAVGELLTLLLRLAALPIPDDQLLERTI
jgi:DNA-binding response OmpR family regulator